MTRVGSTNALALDHARAGDPGKLWVVSKKQESGRGRRGRAWATPEGNLAATLLVVTGGELRLAATLGFVAGLALADALDAVVPQGRIAIGLDGASQGKNRFELKWPNDVLASGAKLAGILLESAILDGGRFAVAVGIGVNVVAYPEDLPYPATSLQAHWARRAMPRHCSWRCRMPGARTPGCGTKGAGCRRSGSAGWRARRGWAARLLSELTAMWCAERSRPLTRTAVS